MFNNGNNGGGNPNHASDGKFTSGPNQAGNGGNKIEQKASLEDKIKEKLGISNDNEPSLEDKVKSNLGMAVEKKKKFDIVKDGKVIGTVEASSPEEAEAIAKQQLNNNPGNNGMRLDLMDDYIKNFKPEPVPTHNGNEQDERKQASQLFGTDLNSSKKSEQDLRDFENSHPFEVEYDYDENGNRNGYELKFSKPEDQEAYEKLFAEVYGGNQENNDYDQKIQSQLGIKNPEPNPKKYIKKDGMIVVVDDNGNPTGEQYPDKGNAEDINTNIDNWEEVESNVDGQTLLTDSGLSLRATNALRGIQINSIDDLISKKDKIEKIQGNKTKSEIKALIDFIEKNNRLPNISETNNSDAEEFNKLYENNLSFYQNER